jgi:hypothetical protein
MAVLPVKTMDLLLQKNNGQSGKLRDHGIYTVWQSHFTGRGVVVTIIDDGKFRHRQEMLSCHVLTCNQWDRSGNRSSRFERQL